MYVSRFLIILALVCVAGVAMPAPAAPAEQPAPVLYSTDFTNTSGWITNSKERFYPDDLAGRYHYLIEGGTGGYGVYALPEAVTGPFILEFDVTPVRTDESGTFRFGIGKESKDSQRGPLIMAELANKKDGRLFYLKTISKENALNLAGSSPSTGSSGNTVRYEDNSTYHIRLTYYATDNRASITVQKDGVPGILFTTQAPVSGKMEDLTHLFLTSIGDGTPGPQAEGYIDNVRLTLPKNQAAVSQTPTPTLTPGEATAAPTLAESILNRTTPETLQPISVSTRVSLPPPPTPAPKTTQKSGGLPLLLIPAFAAAGWLCVRRS